MKRTNKIIFFRVFYRIFSNQTDWGRFILSCLPRIANFFFKLRLITNSLNSFILKLYRQWTFTIFSKPQQPPCLNSSQFSTYRHNFNSQCQISWLWAQIILHKKNRSKISFFRQMRQPESPFNKTVKKKEKLRRKRNPWR